jgi:hypothetical protein
MTPGKMKWRYILECIACNAEARQTDAVEHIHIFRRGQHGLLLRAEARAMAMAYQHIAGDLYYLARKAKPAEAARILRTWRHR